MTLYHCILVFGFWFWFHLLLMLSCLWWSSSLLRNIVTDEATYTTVCICRFMDCVTVIEHFYVPCWYTLFCANSFCENSAKTKHFTLARDFSCVVFGFSQTSLSSEPRCFTACGLGLRPKICRPYGQNQKFPPHARKTSGTQGTSICAFSRVLRLACHRLELWLVHCTFTPIAFLQETKAPASWTQGLGI